MNFHPSTHVLSPIILHSEVRRLRSSENEGFGFAFIECNSMSPKRLHSNIKISCTEMVSYCTLGPTIRCTLTRLHSYQHVKSQSFPFIFNQTPCGPAAAAVAGFHHRLSGSSSWTPLNFRVAAVGVMLQLPIMCLSDLTPTRHSEHDSMSHNELCYANYERHPPLRPQHAHTQVSRIAARFRSSAWFSIKAA